MPNDNLHMQTLADRAPMADEIELLTILWVNRSAFNSSSDFPLWRRRCLTTSNNCNKCRLGIKNGSGQLFLLGMWRSFQGATWTSRTVHGMRGGRCGMLDKDVVGASMVKVRWGKSGAFMEVIRGQGTTNGGRC
jgi:hypothetical protein